jgi:creatinine amidohydrolase
MNTAKQESGANLKRLSIPNIYTAIWWYSSYPNHYAGEGAVGSRELGQIVTENTIDLLVKALKAIKADTKTLELQNEFYDRVKNGKN